MGALESFVQRVMGLARALWKKLDSRAQASRHQLLKRTVAFLQPHARRIAQLTDRDRRRSRLLFPSWVPLFLAQQGVPTIVAARGVYVWDSKGRKLLDARAGSACVSIGHGNARVARAVQAQIRRLSYANLGPQAHPPAVRLAEKLLAIAPAEMERVFFCSGGSEAVDTAIKICRQFMQIQGYRDRTVILFRNGSYHGASYGATSVTGIPDLQAPYGPMLPGVEPVCGVDCADCPLGRSWPGCNAACVDAVEERVLEIGPQRIAAMIAEPIAAWGRVRVPPPEYWTRMQQMLRRHGILLVLDEIMTGMGRTGRWLAASHWDIHPDIVLLGKGLTGAYVPLSALLIHRRICSDFRPHTLLHNYTMGGCPASCAAALAVLPLLGKLLDNASRMGDALLDGLRGLSDRFPSVRDVAGLGLLSSLELHPWTNDPERLRSTLHEALIAERLLTPALPGPVIQLMPPLSVNRSHVNHIIQALERIVSKLGERQPGPPTAAPPTLAPSAATTSTPAVVRRIISSPPGEPAARPPQLEKVNRLCRLDAPLDWTDQKRDLFLHACREMAAHHRDNCPEVRAIYERRRFSPEDIHHESDLERLPWIGVDALKTFSLWSSPGAAEAGNATSSGTSGQRTLVIRDGETGERRDNMMHRLWMQLRLVGDEPVNYLVFAHKPTSEHEPAVVRCFSMLTRYAPKARLFYAVEADATGTLHMKKSETLDTLQQYAAQPIPTRLLGASPLIYETLAQLRGPLRLPSGSLLFTSGGWKKYENLSVDRDSFRDMACRLLDLPPEAVRDGYSMAEHDALYVHCPRHRFHVPAWCRIIVRDPETLRALPPTKVGLLELICPSSTMMPLLALLSMDLGHLDPDPCPCGFQSPTFTLIGRSPGPSTGLESCLLRFDSLVARPE